MKVLGFGEEILSVLDIFSYKVFEKTTNKYLKYLNPYVLLISQCALTIASTGFFLRSSEDLSDGMEALVQTIIVPSITAALLCLILKMENIGRMHSQLQDIADSGKFY